MRFHQQIIKQKECFLKTDSSNKTAIAVKHTNRSRLLKYHSKKLKIASATKNSYQRWLVFS